MILFFEEVNKRFLQRQDYKLCLFFISETDQPSSSAIAFRHLFQHHGAQHCSAGHLFNEHHSGPGQQQRRYYIVCTQKLEGRGFHTGYRKSTSEIREWIRVLTYLFFSYISNKYKNPFAFRYCIRFRKRDVCFTPLLLIVHLLPNFLTLWERKLVFM